MAGTVRAVDRVEIGKTGVRVSRLGLGGVALSGAPPSTDPQAATEEAEAVALIKKSLALGLNYLDTAPMYGVGQSEQPLWPGAAGGAARQLRALHEGRASARSRRARQRAAWHGRSISPGRAPCARSQSSLDRLGLDRVDILLHSRSRRPLRQRAVADTVPLLLELKAQGRGEGPSARG